MYENSEEIMMVGLGHKPRFYESCFRSLSENFGDAGAGEGDLE
jgi:hypothetical protein